MLLKFYKPLKGVQIEARSRSKIFFKNDFLGVILCGESIAKILERENAFLTLIQAILGYSSLKTYKSKIFSDKISNLCRSPKKSKNIPKIA
jgi:hypothetical protein